MNYFNISGHDILSTIACMKKNNKFVYHICSLVTELQAQL